MRHDPRTWDLLDRPTDRPTDRDDISISLDFSLVCAHDTTRTKHRSRLVMTPMRKEGHDEGAWTRRGWIGCVGTNRWVGLDWIGRHRPRDGRHTREDPRGTRARIRTRSIDNRTKDMGATLTLPHAIDTFYRGNPVMDADAFARAFAPDATLEFIGPHAPKDAKGENVVIPAGELRATMANMIAGFSNFTVRDADAPTRSTRRDAIQRGRETDAPRYRRYGVSFRTV